MEHRVTRGRGEPARAARVDLVPEARVRACAHCLRLCLLAHALTLPSGVGSNDAPFDPGAATRFAAEALGFIDGVCAAHPGESVRVRYAPRAGDRASQMVTCTVGEGSPLLPKMIRATLDDM